MKYNLKTESNQAIEKLNELIYKEAKIEIIEKKPRRTLDQNSLYWLWLTVIESESGLEKETLHLLYRAKYLKREDWYITKIIYPELWEKIRTKVDGFYPFDGLSQIIDVISFSTAEIDSKQFTDYLNKIQDHAAQNFELHLKTLDDEAFENWYKEVI